MRNIVLLLMAIAPFIISCNRLKDEPERLFPGGEGFFILNEGNFMAGNGSLSFYSHETSVIYNNLFSLKNTRALGDVPTYITNDGKKGYIIVNNSGTIEVVDMLTLESQGTVTGLSSPRQMAIYRRKAYVSSLNSDNITILDIDDLAIEGTIEIGCSSEAMMISGKKLFVANWAGGDKVVVIDLETDEVIKSIITGLEPESMALDKNGILWVLCTGGYMNEEVPRLTKINTITLEKEEELTFMTLSDNPSSLTINGGGDTLYYIDEGIRRMPVTSVQLPSEPFVPSLGRLFYKVSISRHYSMICVTDAIDYQQKGDLLIFSSSGELLDTEQAGIIPGFMFWMPDFSLFK
jgi:YVTN family beta-propeller protein